MNDYAKPNDPTWLAKLQALGDSLSPEERAAMDAYLQRRSPVTEAKALDLDAIEARANAASKGPWSIGAVETNIVYDANDRHLLETSRHLEAGEVEPNADFVAAARSDVPELVAEVRRLREVQGVLVRACDKAADNLSRLGGGPGTRDHEGYEALAAAVTLAEAKS